MWVKFHDLFTAGEWRGLARASRFVLLELCLHARTGRGRIALSRKMSELDAIVDMLGGDRSEVERAIADLKDEPAALRLEETDGVRELVIPEWSEWNRSVIDEDSARRSREWRASRRARNGVATPFATETQRVGNGAREEETKEEKSSAATPSQDNTAAERGGA